MAIIQYLDLNYSFTQGVSITNGSYVSVNASSTVALIDNYIFVSAMVTFQEINNYKTGASAEPLANFQTRQGFLVYPNSDTVSPTGYAIKNLKLQKETSNDKAELTFALYNGNWDPTTLTSARTLWLAGSSISNNLTEAVRVTVSTTAGSEVSIYNLSLSDNSEITTGDWATFVVAVSSYISEITPVDGVDVEALEIAYIRSYISITDTASNVYTTVVAPVSTLTGGGNYIGTVTDIDEDPLSPDANWITAATTATGLDYRAEFPMPVSAVDLYGTQTIIAKVRKSSSITTNDPLFTIQPLFGNTSAAKHSKVYVTVSDTSGVAVTIQWEVGYDASSVLGSIQRFDQPHTFFLTSAPVGFSFESSPTTVAANNTYLSATAVAITGGTGAVTDIDEDPSSPDANWITANSSSADLQVSVSFTFPANASVAPNVSATLQKALFYVRKNGAGGADIFCNVYLMSAGTTVGAGPKATRTITSDTGEWVTCTWRGMDFASLDTFASNSPAFRVVLAANGGGPNARSGDIGLAGTSLAYFDTSLPETANIDLGAVEYQMQYVTYQISTGGGGGYTNKVIGVTPLSKVIGASGFVKVLGV